MDGRILHRVVLALIPVALLATASMAVTGLVEQRSPTTSVPAVQSPSPTTSQDAAAPPVTTTPRTPVVTSDDSKPQPDAGITEPKSEMVSAAPDLPDEPMPELVVDKAPLTQALAALSQATEQAKLAVTAADAGTQARYVQETINVLAGHRDPVFRAVTAGTAVETYPGAAPLLIEARVKREAAEVQWIAAVQRQMEARSRRLAEIAQSGGTVSIPQGTADLSATVGPTGILGTRGMRPEEQAAEIVNRAIRQSAEALRVPPALQSSGEASERTLGGSVSDEATAIMEHVVRQLETARKIVQIAIDR